MNEFNVERIFKPLSRATIRLCNYLGSSYYTNVKWIQKMTYPLWFCLTFHRKRKLSVFGEHIFLYKPDIDATFILQKSSAFQNIPTKIIKQYWKFNFYSAKVID